MSTGGTLGTAEGQEAFSNRLLFSAECSMLKPPPATCSGLRAALAHAAAPLPFGTQAAVPVWGWVRGQGSKV